MIIQHNIMAINSHRQLGINNTNLGKNLEKLSSGYQINRAADDAAGLAISEKMRAQITAIDRAVLNAQDGASLIQTAEGALTEVHTMLNRLVHLATQSANGTIQADDRQKIEAEVEAIKDEIDRISQATNFNGIQLLDGSLSTTGANAAIRGIDIGNVQFTNTAAEAGSYTLAVTAPTWALNQYTGVEIVLEDGTKHTFAFEMIKGTGGNLVFKAEDGTEYAASATPTATELAKAVKGELEKTELADHFFIKESGGTLTLSNKVAGGKTNAPQIAAIGVSSAAAATKAALLAGTWKNTAAGVANVAADAFKSIALGDLEMASYTDTDAELAAKIFTINGEKFVFIDASSVPNAEKRAELIDRLGGTGVNVVDIAAGDTIAADGGAPMAQLIADKTGLDVVDDGAGSLQFNLPEWGGKVGTGGLSLQVGDTGADYNMLTVSVDDLSTKGLDLTNISMATQAASRKALDQVKGAIEKVSANRGNLGALQNRLEHTINNLNVTSENMTAAESRIRDVDMAKEMMAFTKNNVLAQAAQAMLAQANMQPQQVLQLLR